MRINSHASQVTSTKKRSRVTLFSHAGTIFNHSAAQPPPPPSHTHTPPQPSTTLHTPPQPSQPATILHTTFHNQACKEQPPSQILSLRVYIMPTVSTISRRVYLWCTVSTDYIQVSVYVHSVYKLCNVSTNYARCLHVCTVSTDYTMALVYSMFPCIHKLLVSTWCSYMSRGHSQYANAVSFGTFPGFSELLVQCAKNLFPWGGGGYVYTF